MKVQNKIQMKSEMNMRLNGTVSHLPDIVDRECFSDEVSVETSTGALYNQLK